MGIDRIGKGGGAQPPLAPASTETKGTGAPRAAGSKAAFEVHGGPKPDSTSAAAPAAHASPLERLRRGEVDVHGYMDLKVDEATAHLSGLPATEIAAIRKMLRDQLATDPGLADLVKQATGHTPTPPEE